MSEATRLEKLWEGQFGDEYSERWKVVADRTEFWRNISKFHPRRVLEVGCNVGNNLFYLKNVSNAKLFGVDINDLSLKMAYPIASYLKAEAKDLPFKDGYFDLVFTVGVLIHQPDSTLPRVMSEIYRCSSKYILFAEYLGDPTTTTTYRGNGAAVFRREYDKIWEAMYPELKLVERGTAGHDQGFDELGWVLYEK